MHSDVRFNCVKSAGFVCRESPLFLIGHNGFSMDSKNYLTLSFFFFLFFFSFFTAYFQPGWNPVENLPFPNLVGPVSLIILNRDTARSRVKSFVKRIALRTRKIMYLAHLASCLRRLVCNVTKRSDTTCHKSVPLAS